MRAINIKQLTPKGEHTSIYHIFERLNTGGTPLRAQEIRNCVFRGNLVGIFQELNKDVNWRKILGKNTFDKHQKDVELILRIFSLFENWERYQKPMKEYLNKAMEVNRDGSTKKVKKFRSLFPRATQLIIDQLGLKPFHVRGPLNSSALDSVFCTVLDNLDDLSPDIKVQFQALKNDPAFQESTYYGTSDINVLIQRFELVKRYLIDK